jgi:hypothetical protein
MHQTMDHCQNDRLILAKALNLDQIRTPVNTSIAMQVTFNRIYRGLTVNTSIAMQVTFNRIYRGLI